MTRLDARSADQLRPIEVSLGLQRTPEGSVLYRSGKTTVMISASVSEGVPEWMRDQGSGWVTAEYIMHPRSSPQRQRRKSAPDGRASEIQRLVGRSLRAAVDLGRLGARTIAIDCDVLDADGGTRTACVTGGAIALVMALDHLRKRGLVANGVLRDLVAAVSVGLVAGVPTLDLCYVEDRDAQVDLNVVATAAGKVVEVQGTAEGAPMERSELDAMIDLALGSMDALAKAQRDALALAGVDPDRLR
jgi:ribonuclease PH